MNIFVAELRGNGIFFVICTRLDGTTVKLPRRDARVAEEARLESV